jgi:hypothetical protein
MLWRQVYYLKFGKIIYMEGFRTRICIDIRIDLSCWIRIRIWNAKSGSTRANMTHKNRKSSEISCFKVLDVCSLGFLYRGLEISKLQFFIKNIYFHSRKFFSRIFDHQNPGSGTGYGSEIGS